MDRRMPTDEELERARKALSRACEPAVRAIRDFGDAAKRLQAKPRDP